MGIDLVFAARKRRFFAIVALIRSTLGNPQVGELLR
jgi:hypothetical protein